MVAIVRFSSINRSYRQANLISGLSDGTYGSPFSDGTTVCPG